MMRGRLPGWASVLVSLGVLASPGMSGTTSAGGEDPVICTGVIAWMDTPDTPRIEAMRLKAGPHRVLLYADASGISDDDALTCANGICSSTTATRTGLSTTVVKVGGGPAYGRDLITIVLDAVFVVISIGGTEQAVMSVTGHGAFLCDNALPEGLLAGQQ